MNELLSNANKNSSSYLNTVNSSLQAINWHTILWKMQHRITTIHLKMTFTSKHSSCCFINLRCSCFGTSQLRHSLSSRPPLRITSQEWRKKHKKKAFLPSEKEDSQTLLRALISLQMHIMSQAISHSTTGESKSVRKGRRIKDLLQTHAIFTSHKLSPYSLTRLDLARMPSQGRDSSLRSLPLHN